MVVPTLNRVEDLRRCLTALARQTRPADRIVVVVHDSDAATQQALAAWRDRGSEVRATTVRARGLPAALNAGLDAAAGDVICFTDDDAEPWPDWLARIEAHYRDPFVGAVGGRDLPVSERAGMPARCSRVGRVFWYGRCIRPSRPPLLEIPESFPDHRETAKIGAQFFRHPPPPHRFHGRADRLPSLGASSRSFTRRQELHGPPGRLCRIIRDLAQA